MKSMKMRLLCALLPALLAMGCTSTDVVSPSDPEKKSDVITLSVSAPEAYAFPSTRAAHEGHQLRYVAKLYKADGNYPINSGNFLARKELLASSGTISFVATEGARKYAVAIFADYVPDNVTADANGCYKDKFYDTQDQGDVVNMLCLKSKEGNITYPENSINNDNFDCFVGQITIDKGESAVEKSITLKRAVSKIIFRDNGASGSRPDGVESITLSEFSFMSEYKYSVGYSSVCTKVTNPNVGNLTPKDNGELFYFYTFASGQSDGTPGLDVIKFSITPINDEFEYNEVATGGSLIRPKANFIYKVEGQFFLPTKSTPLPGDMINIRVSADDNWGETTGMEI